MKKIIEPSLLALDKINYKQQLQKVKDLNLKYVHYDVMDKDFIGHTALTSEYFDILEQLGIWPNVHLMVQNPMEYIDFYKDFKVNSISFHLETQNINESEKILKYIQGLGIKSGISVKMETDLSNYLSLAKYCDFVLIMSVNPGLGGQAYSNACIKNLKTAQDMKKINPNITIQLDGGVNGEIIDSNYELVDNFISGSWFFKNIDMMQGYINKLNKKEL